MASIDAITRFGPYEVVARLGVGGTGEVYRAHDPRLNRHVAIKVLGDHGELGGDRLARFELEARAAGSLNHPNLLAIHDVGTQDGVPFLVSELLEGETLRDEIRSGGLPAREVAGYGAQIARGLAAAHRNRYIHRDLKPENLFLCADGRIKILDFGLAKLLDDGLVCSDDETLSDQLTGAGTILGTVGYMSPEQVRGEPADERSDIFALGAVLFELLSGRSPFRASSRIETLHAILASEPPELAVEDRRSRALQRIILRCLEKEPAHRFQCADDLAFALGSLSVPAMDLGQDAAQSPKASEGRMDGRWWLAAALLVVAVGVIGPATLMIARGEPAWGRIRYHRLTFRLGLVPGARFTPDGGSLVYAAGWEGKPVRLFSSRTDGPGSRPFDVPPAGLFSISHDGTLAIALDCQLNWGFCSGTLAVMPLAGGAPREILENVDSADWDPAGKELAIVRALDGRYRIEYPIGKVLFSTEGWIGNLRFSPDGKWLAFCEHPTIGSTDGNVSIVDREGHRRNLTGDSKVRATLLGLAWSPDGHEVWFTAADSGVHTDVWSVDLTGRVRRVLRSPSSYFLRDIAPDGRVLLVEYDSSARMFAGVRGREHEQPLSWFDWSSVADLSSDGKQLLFYEWGDATHGEPVVFLRPTDGGDAIRLGDGRALALSPDGRWALAVRTRPRQLVLLPLGPGEPRTLDSTGIEEYYRARWFPDSMRILFTGEGEDHVARTYYQRIDGGAAQPAPALGILATQISPRGRTIAGYGVDGRLYTCEAEGESCEEIRGARPGDAPLEWSSDGRALFLMATSDSAVEIFRLELGTGTREPWLTIEPSDTTGLVGIESGQIRLTPDGRSYAYNYWRAQQRIFVVEGLR
jgi:hypothetical protein